VIVLPDVRVACLGAGYFAQFHYDSWRRIDRVQLVGACDLDLERATATDLPAFTQLDHMLHAIDVDLLDIILPPENHAQAIRTAIAAGVKWIICQKPFCRDLTEAEQIVDTAEAAGVTVIVHENFRFQPWYRAIKRVLDLGDLGTVHQATFRMRPGDGQGPRAYLDRQPYFQKMPRFLIHETGVHWVDTFRYLLGNPHAVYADLRRINPAIAGEDAGVVLFDHPHGARSVLDANRHIDHNADNQRRTMGTATVEGTNGTLTLGGDGSVTLRLKGQQKERPILPADSWNGFGGDCVHALQSHVISGVLDGGPLENVARDYLDVIKIEQAIYASSLCESKVYLEKEGQQI